MRANQWRIVTGANSPYASPCRVVARTCGCSGGWQQGLSSSSCQARRCSQIVVPFVSRVWPFAVVGAVDKRSASLVERTNGFAVLCDEFRGRCE